MAADLDVRPPHPADTRQATSTRVPPHNLDAEMSVLGAMLINRDAILAAIDAGLATADFYKPQFGHVYEAITDLYAAGEPADLITVAEALDRRNLLDHLTVGDDRGARALMAIQAATPATSNAGTYARMVRGHAQLRRLISVGGEIAEMGYSQPDDVPATVDLAEALVFGLAEANTGDATDGRTLASLTLDRIEHLTEHAGEITGLATGYTDLDDMLAGLQPGTLNVLGARPAMGKSCLALGIAAHCAINLSRPALMFSLEMSEVEIGVRLVSAVGHVDHDRLRKGRLLDADWSKVSHAMGAIGGAPIYVDDNQERSVTQMRAAARRLKARLGDLGVVVVDYLQLMTSGGRAENRQVEIAEISRGLKIMARELQVPVVALSQLSRNLEQRAEKRPMLADLRESGSLEQDADVVMFLYRDEVYHQDTPDRGIAELIVAKHRAGPTGVARLLFMGHTQRFANFARSM